MSQLFKGKTCNWQPSPDRENAWVTDCANLWIGEDLNKIFTHCPSCGGTITQNRVVKCKTAVFGMKPIQPGEVDGGG